MFKRNITRAIVWLLLIVLLSIITHYNYQIFITNSVEKEIAEERIKSSVLQRQITQIRQQINNYNQNIFDDGKYQLAIPDNDKDILLNYAIAPLLIVDSNYSLPTIKEEMPTSIEWTKNNFQQGLKAKKITVEFEILPQNFEKYLQLLQNMERLIYIGDYRITILDDLYSTIKVWFNYYIFYIDPKTT